MELKVRKEFEELQPRMQDEEFEALKRSMQSKGYDPSFPIIVDETNTILDGHHRYRASKELAMNPTTIKRESFKDDFEKKDFIWLCSLRRNLNFWQKAVQAKLKEALEAEKAKQRMTAGKKDPMPNSAEGGAIREILAKQVGMGHNTLERAFKIMEVATEEVKTKLRNEEWTINYAYQGYQTLEKVTDKDMKKQLKENFEEEHITPAQLIKIVGLTNIAEEEIGNTTETIAEKVREKFGSQFWTESLDIKELEHSIRELEGAPQELKAIEIETTRFGSKDEAEKFFKKCGGHLSGLKSYYIGKVDPLKYKPIETKEEE